MFLGVFYPLWGLEITWGAALAVVVGGLLADIDTRNSTFGFLFPFLTRALKARGVKHGTYTHSILALPVVFAVFVLPPSLLDPQGFQVYFAVPLGYVSHLFADALNKGGVRLLFPLRRNYVFVYPMNRAWRIKSHTRKENWLFLGAALLAVILVPLGHPGLVALMKKPVVSPSNAVETYYSLSHGHVVNVRVEGVWRDTQEAVEVAAPVLGALGEEELLIYYEGDVYAVGRQPGAGIYPTRVEAVKGVRGGAESRTVYFEYVPLEYVLSEVKRGAGRGIVVLTGEMEIRGGEDHRWVLLRLNRRSEAYPTVSLRGGTMSLFYTPLDKLDHFVGRGVYVYSARLTVREIRGMGGEALKNMQG